ncbi:hypothetical protein KAR29_08880 [Aminithiophilus ramosus]|uniref:MerR family transcriptional regulator n=2 Tax=Synergistales TaxID=649776 RepID=A0A9Q7EW83_9BACT|nr:hypothetical protein [Aminithiophilus ramosus]QTX31480.1 hypothetical protein KAR29_08880 [Aminithiophilus ramosus]QVL35290.1 hypothetical protein KIH16_08735 [Synergistota bacterium]
MTVQLRNCTICSKAYVYQGGRQICGACRDELDLLFVEVRNFLRDHPRFTPNVPELALVMGIDERKIQALKDDGRLQIVGPGTGTGRCQICGEACEGGHICAKCLKALGGESRRSSAEMFVLRRRREKLER